MTFSHVFPITPLKRAGAGALSTWGGIFGILRLTIEPTIIKPRSVVLSGKTMRSRTLVMASAVTAFTLSCAASASAGAVIFDSLDGAYSFPATTIFGPPLAATFTTGASAVRVDVALSLSSIYLQDPSPGETYTVSLDGGIPLSDLSFDPINGLMSADGSVRASGSVIESVTLPLTSLPSILTIERYDEFSGEWLNPNSLYWIEVSTEDHGDAAVAWGITRDVSGPGVASNYLEADLTNEAFFLNEGVDPWPSDDAFRMEIDAAPEPSTWLMMALGFAGLGFFAHRWARGAASV